MITEFTDLLYSIARKMPATSGVRASMSIFSEEPAAIETARVTAEREGAKY